MSELVDTRLVLGYSLVQWGGCALGEERGCEVGGVALHSWDGDPNDGNATHFGVEIVI
jgi:hypothetical protein